MHNDAKYNALAGYPLKAWRRQSQQNSFTKHETQDSDVAVAVAIFNVDLTHRNVVVMDRSDIGVGRPNISTYGT